MAASMTLEPLGEVGANFSLQLSSRTQFTKINNKKVIAENQCEKHKKSSLVLDFLSVSVCVSVHLILLTKSFLESREYPKPICFSCQALLRNQIRFDILLA